MDGRRSAGAHGVTQRVTATGGRLDDPPPPAAPPRLGEPGKIGANCASGRPTCHATVRNRGDLRRHFEVRQRTTCAIRRPWPRLDTMAPEVTPMAVRRDGDHVVRPRLRRGPDAGRQGRAVRSVVRESAQPAPARAGRALRRDARHATATPTTPATRCRSPAGRGPRGPRSTSCSSGSTASTRRPTTSSA